MAPVADPAFQAEMTKRNLDIGLKSAESLREVIEEARHLNPKCSPS